MQPRVSVIIAVHGERYTAERTLESVSAQYYTDFEVVLVDDGSRDSTAAALKKICEEKAWSYIRNERNVGLTRSLIRGIRHSSGGYLARIDAGDLMHPERLARQVQFLDEHSDVGLVGTAAQVVVQKEGAVWYQYTRTTPPDHAQIVKQLCMRNPITHVSVMFRREAYEEAGGYDPDMSTTQDYDLWIRMSSVCNLAALPDILTTVIYDTNDSISFSRNKIQLLNGMKVKARGIAHRQLPVFRTALGLAKNALMCILPNVFNHELRRIRFGRSG